ncbi:MAG: DUF4238 domain-containing protein, partial [Desulfobacterales bacterium]|nr:DUF4238 domain-containing protein [Desulfobacterales bacterium]
MKKEKTQKGNPQEVTVWQHILPKVSIDRFTNNNGRVELYLKPESKVLKPKPTDKIFCGYRLWDHASEHGYMKSIEGAFQEIASKVVAGKISELDYGQEKTLLAFYALLELRSHYKRYPQEDLKLDGVLLGEDTFSKDQEEQLEKRGMILFCRNATDSAAIPGRLATGLNIEQSIAHKLYQNEGLKWGILQSNEGEFIVSDSFDHIAILPISPRIILMGNSRNQTVSKNNVCK